MATTLTQPEPIDPSGELPLDLDFEPGKHPRTAQQLVYEVLRRGIMNGSLPQNTRLGQNQIAAQLSISSTPVREALRRLAGDDLVRIDTHRGAVVNGLDAEELNEIYEMRLLLEPLATRKAANRIKPEALEAAAELCDRMDRESDPAAWSQTNREFHSIIVAGASSPNLSRVLRGLQDRSAFYVQWSIVANPGIPERANHEHRQILEACRRGDADLAAEIEKQHLLATLHAVMKTSYPSA